jgi:hypothetical protein
LDLLDSGFRRNDIFKRFSTFYEAVNIDVYGFGIPVLSHPRAKYIKVVIPAAAGIQWALDAPGSESGASLSSPA